MNFCKSITFLLFLLFVISLQAQPPLPSPSGRLVIKQGANLDFIFNSLKRYANGITYDRWTTLDVIYDSDGGGTTWRLSIKANNATIDGDGGNTLNLNVLEITTLDGGGINNLGAFVQPKITLTDLDQDLVMGNPPDGGAGDNLVDLTYECGVTNSVLGEMSDYYVVDLVITLYED
jgi:hypothetical protein